ncbi:hypothetical protein FRC06_001116 [Ceratobasidium sp. 370]|nr:hypothetical protein FRC06_001116 [Ceratobasidium sp. 370]
MADSTRQRPPTSYLAPQGRGTPTSRGSGRGRGSGQPPTNFESPETSQSRGRGKGRGRGTSTGRGRGQEPDHNGPPSRRDIRIQIANETTTLLFKEPYRYTLSDGTSVVVRDRVKESSRRTAYFAPQDVPAPEPAVDALADRLAALGAGMAHKNGPDSVRRNESPDRDIIGTDALEASNQTPPADSTLNAQVRTDFTPPHSRTTFTILERSVVAAARDLGTAPPGRTGAAWHIPMSAESKTGVLNFASAKHPGGGFLTGTKTQEEALCRASTLYASLVSERAESFYGKGNRGGRGRGRGRGRGGGEAGGGHATSNELDREQMERGVYSDSMLYTPGVVMVRDEWDEWASPVLVNVVTSAAVNAEVVRQRARIEAEEQGTQVDEVALELHITQLMRSRMHRVLALFLQRGDSKLVLGSFGTGILQNRVRTVVTLWAELLAVPGAPFENAFEAVEFAIRGGTVAEVRRVWGEIVGGD